MAEQTRSASQSMANAVECIGREVLGRGYDVRVLRDDTSDDISISVTKPVPQAMITVSPEVTYAGSRHMADVVTNALQKAREHLDRPQALLDFIQGAALELSATGDRLALFVSHRDFSDLVNRLVPLGQLPGHKSLQVHTANGPVRIVPTPLVGNYSLRQASSKRDIWWEVTKAMRDGDVKFAKEHAKDALVELVAESEGKKQWP